MAYVAVQEERMDSKIDVKVLVIINIIRNHIPYGNEGINIGN